MLIIQHRINTIKDMIQTPNNLGIEIDIRSYKDELILNHEPYIKGEKLIDFLDKFENKFIILNVKEEGLENRLIKLMRLYKIKEYFFLDQSFPFLIKTAKNGETKCAVRLSEYESINTVFSLSNIVDWVWIDFFNNFPLSYQQYFQLKESKFKICLVSNDKPSKIDL